MAAISQKTFEMLTEKEKEDVRHDYHVALSTGNGNVVHELENLFGKENLKTEPKIRTWKDLMKEVFSIKDYLRKFDENDFEDDRFTDAAPVNGKFFDRLMYKAGATHKIHKLIEYGYGGIVTDEEWLDKELSKWFIIVDTDGKLVIDSSEEPYRYFISFHTKEQAEEFMSYPENVKLVRRHYMI